MKSFLSLLKSGAAEVTDEQKDAVEAFDSAIESLQKSEDVQDDSSLESKDTDTPVETNDDSNAEESSDDTSTPDEEAGSEDTDDGAEETQKSEVSEENDENLFKSESLEDIINSDEEAGAAMDVEPYLKSLTEGVSKVLENLKKSVEAKLNKLEERVDEIGNLQKAQSDVLIAEGKLIKSVLSVDSESMGEPLNRKSVLTSDRFFKSASGEKKSLTKSEMLVKLNELAKSKVLTPQQVTKVEGRIGANLELPDYFTKHLEETSEE